MNPIEWLKAIYETFGSPYPRLSLVLVMVISALLGGAIWQFAAKQATKSSPTRTSPSQMTGTASTRGDQSPAVAGNQNNIQYDQPSPKAKQRKH